MTVRNERSLSLDCYDDRQGFNRITLLLAAGLSLETIAKAEEVFDRTAWRIVSPFDALGCSFNTHQALTRDYHREAALLIENARTKVLPSPASSTDIESPFGSERDSPLTFEKVPVPKLTPKKSNFLRA